MFLLGDFCNRVSTSSNVRLKKVVIKNSNVVQDSCFMLYRLGYIMFYCIKNFKHISVFLKYSFSGSVIRNLICLSKPSIKFYMKKKNIMKFVFRNFFGSIGFMALATNKGKIMLDFDCALSNIGGIPIWLVC